MEIIVGALVSVGVQILKKYFGIGSWQIYFTVILASIVASLIYFVLQSTELLDSFIKVFSGAGIFYTFIITRLEAKE